MKRLGVELGAEVAAVVNLLPEDGPSLPPQIVAQMRYIKKAASRCKCSIHHASLLPLDLETATSRDLVLSLTPIQVFHLIKYFSNLII